MKNGQWTKSSHSGNGGGNCVEVQQEAGACGRVRVRDSKDPDGPALVFGPDEWKRFTASVPR